jgi:hypothetical protein
MNKWGEIGRFNHDDKLFILSTFKKENIHDKENLYCPSFSFEISTKSAKKTRDKKLSKLDMKFSLLSEGNKNLILIRQVIQTVKTYLQLYPTEFVYLGYYGYGREQDKRFKTYSYVMKQLGYEIHKHYKRESYWDSAYTFYKKIN